LNYITPIRFGVGSADKGATECEGSMSNGQRDDKKGAKKELTALWVNKDLAKKNFVKYTE